MKHVGTFGYTRNRTPLTALAKERTYMSVDAVAQTNLELFSHFDQRRI
jgi:hypothetical protein